MSAWDSVFTVAARSTKVHVNLRHWTSNGVVDRTDVCSGNHLDMIFSSRAMVLECYVIPVLFKHIRQRSVPCPSALLTSKTMLKPFSDDALQKMHGPTGLLTARAANLRHDMVKRRKHCTATQTSTHRPIIGRHTSKTSEFRSGLAETAGSGGSFQAWDPLGPLI